MARGRALKGEILKLSHEGEEKNKAPSITERQTSRILKDMERRMLKRKEERRAKNDIKMITPLSPLGRKTNAAIRVPVPAPKRSEKYILFTSFDALIIAKEIVRPAKKKGRLRRT
jgi:hypothetical protein